MTEDLLKYYCEDDYCAGVWLGKYAIKNLEGEFEEKTPDDMHLRMAKEFWRMEKAYNELAVNDEQRAALSESGRWLEKTKHITELAIYNYLKDFKRIIPQGSIMTMLGNKYKIGSLSNCFVIPSPADSYGGILKTDEHLVQLMKRRGGVGLNLNTLRPEDTPVSNAAGTSTGASSFMSRYSNSTREVAQNGRRGALMLLLSCLHPSIFKFVKSKADLTKVTGANISTMLTDSFMDAAEAGSDFLCKFPVDRKIDQDVEDSIMEDEKPRYNQLLTFKDSSGDFYGMLIKAKELFDLIVEMAHSNGEPGLAFIDAIHNYSPDGVYHLYRAIASNPCGEQWMQAYDACRLLALNLYNAVDYHFTKSAKISTVNLYDMAYMQQRLADHIVDLEIEYVQKIIDKIVSDPEDESTKRTELELWIKVKETATNSRRTGCGFTGMADMLAALRLKYDSDGALDVIKKVMQIKMRAELDCTIDLAILKGSFEGWDKNKEFVIEDGKVLRGQNKFYQMLLDEFPEQVERMCKWGRRNVSWSTVAPTGTVSVVAKLRRYSNISAGVEPVFFPWYFRNKKVNANEKDVRVDFVDQNGDSWTTYPVIMGGFREWLDVHAHKMKIDKVDVNKLTKMELESYYEISPYFQACANDISWERRVEIQSVVQRYTTNAISSTLNLPNNVSKETVGDIYLKAWKLGLKGVTVYRDGCRTGVLVKEIKEDGFSYRDSVKRPKELDGELHITTVKGVKYGVVIGLFNNNPYEIFAFNLPDDIKSSHGKLIKVKKNHYNFESSDGELILRNLQSAALHHDEQLLTRLISGMLRHGAKPQFIMEQIDKCELEIVSYGKAISRILKKYCKEDELVSRTRCSDCNSTDIRMQEGCAVCNSCGSSKCG